jgi:AcrR family transcriptional regulator
MILATRISSPRPQMRKEPRQARSRATVESIVQAGTRVLSDRGWAGFNTNEVADTAGVSIGSLYQYFPDKEALVEAILQRHLDDVLAVLSESEAGGRSLKQLVDDLVTGMIAAHGVHPALHRVLLDVVAPHLGSSPAQAKFEATYLARYRAIVAACPRSRGKAADEIVAQVLCAMIEGVIHSAARSGALKSDELKRELIHAAYSYLTGGEP